MLDQPQRNADFQGKRLDLNSINTQLANDLKGFRSLDPSQPSAWEGKDSIDSFKKASYGEELRDQITQRQEKKYLDLHSERQNDLRLMRERLENDPFGKQGSGAPLRDQYGNIITAKNKALHQLHDYPRGQFNGAQPAFSLKARLARENIVSHSLDAGANPQGFDANRRALSQADMPVQNVMPQQSPFAMGASMFQPIFLPPPPSYFYPPPPNYYTPQHHYQQPPQSLGAFTERGERDDYLNSPPRDLSHKRYTSVDRDMAYPYADKMRDKEKRKERIQKYIDYQNDLLMQIDEKRRKRENNEDLEKIQDDLDNTRIKRENEEIRAYDHAEAEKRKKTLERSQQINDKLSAGLNFIVSGKNKGKRPRTPVEEVEERLRMEKSLKDSAFGLTIKTEKDEKSVLLPDSKSAEILKEALKNLTPMERQMLELKGTVKLQNTFLQDQIVDVKRKMLDIAKERILTSYEVEELRHKLKQQRVIDEIKRTEMYDAMLYTTHRPPLILPTTTFVTPALDDVSPLLSTLAPTNIYKPSTARLVERLNSRPMSTASGFNSKSGIDYLSYFNTGEDHNGISVNDNGRYNLPEGKTDEYTPYKISDSVGSVLKRNKEKLEVLEDLERKGPQAYGEQIGLVPAKKTRDQVNDEVSQMLDDLLVHVNASKNYADKVESRTHLDDFL